MAASSNVEVAIASKRLRNSATAGSATQATCINELSKTSQELASRLASVEKQMKEKESAAKERECEMREMARTLEALKGEWEADRLRSEALQKENEALRVQIAGLTQLLEKCGLAAGENAVSKPHNVYAGLEIIKAPRSHAPDEIVPRTRKYADIARAAKAGNEKAKVAMQIMRPRSTTPAGGAKNKGELTLVYMRGLSRMRFGELRAAFRSFGISGAKIANLRCMGRTLEVLLAKDYATEFAAKLRAQCDVAVCDKTDASEPAPFRAEGKSGKALVAIQMEALSQCMTSARKELAKNEHNYVLKAFYTEYIGKMETRLNALKDDQNGGAVVPTTTSAGQTPTPTETATEESLADGNDEGDTEVVETLATEAVIRIDDITSAASEETLDVGASEKAGPTMEMVNGAATETAMVCQ